MAITRKDIKAILPDIEDDALKNLLSRIHEETDALKDANDDLQQQLTASQKEADTAKAAKEKAEKDLSDYKTEQSDRETKSKKEAAAKVIMREIGIPEKYIDRLLKTTDLSGYDLDESGKFKKASDLEKSLKDENADFITVRTESGAKVPNPPTGGGKAGKYSSREEIMQIKNTAERQAAIAENHELFGI